ncbi:hypothetical protein MRB53_033095 [Persea americana]|uniref:Uncharacterized protein n=1 Tax=Persea americana TaxID=3435 RepID=A0ACC2KU14_PERAE|nr:hypothetical protein MRB53_033095 [Persea americana]
MLLHYSTAGLITIITGVYGSTNPSLRKDLWAMLIYSSSTTLPRFATSNTDQYGAQRTPSMVLAYGVKPAALPPSFTKEALGYLAMVRASMCGTTPRQQMLHLSC